MTLIRPGDTWRSRDKRDNGVCVTVVAYSGPGGYVTIKRFNQTRVRVERFTRRYEPVEELNKW